MAHRIDITHTVHDTRASTIQKQLNEIDPSRNIIDLQLIDTYTIDSNLTDEELEKVKNLFINPVFQEEQNDKTIEGGFTYAIEIGFLPGVTDNVGATAYKSIADVLQRDGNGQSVYSSQVMLVTGTIAQEHAQHIGESIANPLIQRIHLKNYREFVNQEGMDTIVPKVTITEKPTATLVNILDADDNELITIGKYGIHDHDKILPKEKYIESLKLFEDDTLKLGDLFERDGQFFQKVRRGPLALDLTYMHTIQNHFRGQGRNPTDVELESIAQTWSEHCKHNTLANPIDDITDGLYKQFIQKATNDIRKAKGKDDFCVSVFTDNAGAIAFDDHYLITDKVETHNSPSALDPFGGSITGIVGVNRDAIGCGLGAKPILNRYGFCFADPNDTTPLFKGKENTQQMLSPRRIMDGVIDGVNEGGNCSGISTPQGFMYIDKRFKGKPLVFVGTVGLLPRKSNGRMAHEKQAQPGDYVVMIGGRVGKDGIHGATFSSEAIDSGSPATAVQIGDPITQKRLSDAIVKEARDKGLYTSITDNGAGGLSCSVAEMGKESGGCYVDLNKVPLKYPGLEPWEIWISESQERMTLSVPEERWQEFSRLMQRRGVEATVIGEFTDSGKCVVDYDGNNVMNIDMAFLHDGLPKRPMTTTFTKKTHEEPYIPIREDLTQTLHNMLERKNIASIEFISTQYDHEVQGGSVLKPLQGRGRVNGDATIARPLLYSNKGVVVSHGINPSYSDIDTYHMAAAAIDTAIRNAVSVGAPLEKIALLDNFCWCSSDEPERLGQLKEAVKACYDTAVAYETPFISGKDSMFNDFKGFDEHGNPVKISIPPTLLISSIGVMDNINKAVSLDAKMPKDLVYIVGLTHNELGASEYFNMFGEQFRGEGYIGNNVPQVDTDINKDIYKSMSQGIENGLIASAQSIHRGGLGVALAKTAMGGRLGMDIQMEKIPGYTTRHDYTLFSESMGRMIVTVDPHKKEQFEEVMGRNIYSQIGTVRSDNTFTIRNLNNPIVNTTVDKLLQSYKSTFKGY